MHHCLAWFLSENGNSFNLIVSSMDPFILNMLQTSRKFTIWAFESSSCNPSNCINCYTIWMIFGLILKLLIATIGLTILDSISIKDGLVYSDIILCGFTMIFDWFTSSSISNSSALYSILALRFWTPIFLISGSLATNSEGLFLVLN